MNTALDDAAGRVGNRRRLAKLLGISSQAVYHWEQVPVRRVLDVERITGVSRQRLRPDVYPPERNAA